VTNYLTKVESEYLKQGMKWAEFGRELGNTTLELLSVSLYLQAAFIAHLASPYREAKRQALSVTTSIKILKHITHMCQHRFFRSWLLLPTSVMHRTQVGWV